MTFKRRFKLTEQQNDMWRRWKAGQSLHEIGRAFSKDHVSIQFMPGAAWRDCSCRAATLTADAYVGGAGKHFNGGIACGSSIREIARGLERAVSTVSREVAAMAGDLCFEPVTPISKPGTRPCDPSGAFLPCT
jgi:hypothetical protein